MANPPRDDQNDGKSDHAGIRTAVDIGADMVGGAAGGVLGFLLAGPVGAGVAGVAGVAITRSLLAAGDEVCDRLLSPREKARVGAAITVAATQTQKRLENGDRVRDDNFINDGSNRPPVEEVTEGLLLAAQRAYDEKKVPYIGRLSANLNFRRDLDVQCASVLVRFADQLSYQQLCLLRLCHDNAGVRPLKGGKLDEGRIKNPAHGAVLATLLELERLGFVNNGGVAVLSLSDLDPPKMRPQLFGVHLFTLMELNLIPEEDLRPIRAALEAPSPVYVTTQPKGNKSSSMSLTGEHVIARRATPRSD